MENEITLDKQGSILAEKPKLHMIPISPAERLKFAGRVLLGIGILFATAMYAEIILDDVEVFEACKTILPPIATLIIGYYFGESKS